MSAPYSISGWLQTPHGFFNRLGGSSHDDFSTNNVSYAVGDDPARVDANRAAVAEAFGYEANALQILKQVHSAEVRVLSQPLDGVVEADAMVTNRPDLLLGILTADCTPILLADTEAGVIGAAHAGWRGAASGIAETTVMGMVALGADPARIVAAIGPTISGVNYEVGPQFAADLLGLYPTAGNRIFVPEGGVEHFDLPGFVEDCLRNTGITKVDTVGGCTYEQPQCYFSHRRATHEGKRTGRQIAVIGLT
jgi:YfiH family protein